MEHIKKTIHTFYEFCYWTISNKILCSKYTYLDLYNYLENLTPQNISILNEKYRLLERYLACHKFYDNISYCRTIWHLIKSKNIKPVTCLFSSFDNLDIGNSKVFGLCYRTNNQQLYFPNYYYENDIAEINRNFTNVHYGNKVTLIDESNFKNAFTYNQGPHIFSNSAFYERKMLIK